MRLCEEDHLVWGQINLKWIFLPVPVYWRKHCSSGSNHLLVVEPHEPWIKSTNTFSSKCFQQWRRKKLCPGFVQLCLKGWSMSVPRSCCGIAELPPPQLPWSTQGVSREWGTQGEGSGCVLQVAGQALTWHPRAQHKRLLQVHAVPRACQSCHACAGHLWWRDGDRRAPAEHSCHSILRVFPGTAWPWERPARLWKETDVKLCKWETAHISSSFRQTELGYYSIP